MGVTGRTEKAEIATALAATPAETAQKLCEAKRDRAMTEKARDILAEAGLRSVRLHFQTELHSSGYSMV